jgi:hypothetical protein
MYYAIYRRPGGQVYPIAGPARIVAAGIRSVGTPTPTKEGSVTLIGIILGSTRPNRNGEQVAAWVLEHASRRDDTCRAKTI